MVEWRAAIPLGCPTPLPAPYCFDILLIPLWFDYDSDWVFGHHEVPMLQVFRSFDGSEILIIAAASILVASITLLL